MQGTHNWIVRTSPFISGSSLQRKRSGGVCFLVFVVAARRCFRYSQTVRKGVILLGLVGLAAGVAVIACFGW